MLLAPYVWIVRGGCLFDSAHDSGYPAYCHSEFLNWVAIDARTAS